MVLLLERLHIGKLARDAGEAHRAGDEVAHERNVGRKDDNHRDDQQHDEKDDEDAGRALAVAPTAVTSAAVAVAAGTAAPVAIAAVAAGRGR